MAKNHRIPSTSPFFNPLAKAVERVWGEVATRQAKGIIPSSSITQEGIKECELNNDEESKDLFGWGSTNLDVEEQEEQEQATTISYTHPVAALSADSTWKHTRTKTHGRYKRDTDTNMKPARNRHKTSMRST